MVSIVANTDYTMLGVGAHLRFHGLSRHDTILCTATVEQMQFADHYNPFC